MVKAFWGLKAWLRVEAGFDELSKPRLMALNFVIKMYVCKSKFFEPTLTLLLDHCLANILQSPIITPNLDGSSCTDNEWPPVL